VTPNRSTSRALDLGPVVSGELETPMREQIRSEVEAIHPLDELERATISDALRWIDSGSELCRIKRPATPDKHLVSYFAIVDSVHLLLVDHINAELWLPPGGHVEPNEHPRETALREAKEELAVEPCFLFEHPILITSTETVGRTAGHTDVSLWYVFAGDVGDEYVFDRSEFAFVQWFHRDEVPLERSDPHMARFLAKLYGTFRCS
jgi:8-oxo-dGTP diphosphatase